MKRSPAGAQRLFVLLLPLVFAGGAVISTGLAWAEHLLAGGAPDGVRRSLAVVPGNAHAWELWAAAAPDEALPSLERAVHLNPYLTSARLDLALRAESAGKQRAAEDLLLEAFRHDRMFRTRWTLANFYFRSGDQAGFWRWSRASAEYAHSNFFWLFELCHRVSPDAALVLDKAIPPRPIVLHEYLSYLQSTSRLDGISETFNRLVSFRRPEDLPPLLSAVDRRLASGDTPGAIDFWNQLARSRLIPHPTLDPAQGHSLTNGSFKVKPLAAGFDWRLNWNPEAFVSGNRIEFSGKQLDRTELLWQPLALAPNGSYTLYCRYRTPGIAADSGLRWHLLDTRTRQPLVAASPNLSSDSETRLAWHFQVPASAALLMLGYDRTPGTTTLQGTLELLSVDLVLAHPLGEHSTTARSTH